MKDDISTEIRQFYDASSGLWEQIWGEHMHHGYYGRDGTRLLGRRQAQIEMVEELLKWSGRWEKPDWPRNILDVGCGIGGSSLYLAQHFGAQVAGITLSPVQATRATARAREAGLASRVQFQVADALKVPFADHSFDLVWSLESGEHMADKTQFLQECYRVLQPGGKLILATWCHRPAGSMPLTRNERRHLEKIYRVYCLPYILSLDEYQAIAEKCGFKDLRCADWSKAVAPFWDVVIDSAVHPQAIIGLLKAGWQTINAALSLRLMSRGYRRGLIRFGLISGRK